MEWKIFEHDKGLLPYRADIEQRMLNYFNKRSELVGKDGSLSDFANAHEYFGFHRTKSGWVYREWAPAADELFLTGDMVSWNIYALPMTRLENGVFEVYLEGKDALWNGCHVQTIVKKNGEIMRRIPLYIRRVLQDKDTHLWCGVIVDEPEYNWKIKKFTPPKQLFIYECHIGMAQEDLGVGSYMEFADSTLDWVKKAGYNTIPQPH